MIEIPKTTRRETLFAMAMSILSCGVAAANLPWSAAVTEVLAASNGPGKRLVAYLSRSGNTRVVAGQLKRAFSADLFEIRTAAAWPEDYQEMVAWASHMREASPPPRLAENVNDIAKYDVVFLGSPIWGSALPAPVRTFLMAHDLSGKTLVPFFTYGCCGAGSAPQTMAQLAPRAKILAPFTLKCDQERDTLNTVNAWLQTAKGQL